MRNSYNTRILYHTVLDCENSEVNYLLEHVVDYYPYGKVLREHTNCEDARYLTTHHERDKETDLDYRGARFYDSDIGRFLSLIHWLWIFRNGVTTTMY